MESELKQAILEAQVEQQTQLGTNWVGHDIGPFDEVENGYQSRCRRCHMTTWVGHTGLRYSLLENICPSSLGE